MITVPFPSSDRQRDAEYLLTLRFVLNEATDWAEAGHEVAWKQLSLNPTAIALTPVASTFLPTVSLDSAEGQLRVSGENFTAAFDQQVGGLSSFIYQQQELLAAPLVPNFWRAPTDNDEGGGERSFAQRWRAVGLDQAQFFPRRVVGQVLNDKAVRVTVQGVVESREGQDTVRIATYEGTYTVYGSGDIVLNSRYQIADDIPPLPKVGLSMKLPATRDQLAWYGRGPQETYADRYSSAKIARYSGTVAEQYTPYILPQENGNKTEVRWAALTDNRGVGLFFTGWPANNLNVSAHLYELAAFDQANRTYEVKNTNQVTLNLDYAQAGLGGDDSWSPATHPEYVLDSSAYAYQLRMRPIELNQISPDDLYKEQLPEISPENTTLP